MQDRTDPAAFRASATNVYYAILIGLAVVALCCAGPGWRFGGTWGLVVGAVIGIVLAGCGAAAVTLLWAMTQDGA